MAIKINGVTGTGVKKYNVIVDYSQHYILLPIVPGGDLNITDVSFDTDADVRRLGEVDKEGHIKFLFTEGSLSEEWTVAVKEWGNAITGQFGCFADAEADCFDGKYYVYPTSDGFAGWGGYYFKAFSSPDLVNWTDEGVILDLKEDVSWSDGNAWAPCIIKKNGKYYYYYSANTDKFEKNVGKAVGVAVCDTPSGKFVEPLGHPLVYNTMVIEDEEGNKKEMRYPGQVIDPAVFTDPETGKSYLYWGNGSMWVCELNEDMISLKGEPRCITPPNFREAAHVFYRKGIYYFTWSEDDTRSKNYHVRWGYSDNPMGPIIGNEIMIEKDESHGIYGTGHHTIINVPGTDKWYILYHRFNFPARFEGEFSDYYGVHRELAMDKFTFDDNGRIVKTKPTLEGVTEGEEFNNLAKIVRHTNLDGIDEGEIIEGVVEIQSGECETEMDVIMELYDYQSNLVATEVERVNVGQFTTNSITLKIEAPEKMRGHYLEFFTDDGMEVKKLTY
ncbi:MAG: family 43 glycosylhydrolase [Clostridia bacterium]|nr:family 43 glycosylhydrolase [Clostridia bacterium]